MRGDASHRGKNKPKHPKRCDSDHEFEIRTGRTPVTVIPENRIPYDPDADPVGALHILGEYLESGTVSPVITAWLAEKILNWYTQTIEPKKMPRSLDSYFGLGGKGPGDKSKLYLHRRAARDKTIRSVIGHFIYDHGMTRDDAVTKATEFSYAGRKLKRDAIWRIYSKNTKAINDGIAIWQLVDRKTAGKL